MNELALFAGSGGGLLGTGGLGIRPVCAVEKDPYRRMLLVRRQSEGALPSFPVWDDVHTFDPEPWRGITDIVSGGFPCQAFSSAARGRHTAANLWPEMLRIISELRPRYVFAENVATRAIQQAGDDCAALGYQVEMLALSARDVGADHIRKRYWLLAHADDQGELHRHLHAAVGECKEFHDGFWDSQPGEPRVANGMATRMERYAATGNGQVPAVAAAALWLLAQAAERHSVARR